ncbi:MAG: chloramphenicol acetyltransferase [Pseudomonadota bacterium]|nr:chloramphenicol acetyltransferase [Pseudomonadota bacterium]
MSLLDKSGPTLIGESIVFKSNLGKYTEIGNGCVLSNISMGDYSYCERFCDLANTRIGKFSNISSLVRIGPTDHPWKQASQHHFLYRAKKYWAFADDDDNFLAGRELRTTNIGHDTWIGHGAIIKPDLSVGNGSIVGAGSVVTHDVAPYTIVAGNPAKVLRERFCANIAQRLLDISWWDWEHEILGERLSDFIELDVESFLEKYET